MILGCAATIAVGLTFPVWGYLFAEVLGTLLFSTGERGESETEG